MKNDKKGHSKDAVLIDLMKDEYFVQWILKPNKESNHYWQTWINSNPGRKKDIELARQLIQSGQYQKHYSMPEKDYSRLLQNIVERSQKSDTSKRNNSPKIIKWFAVAASILIISLLGVFFKDFFPIQKLPEQTITSSTIVKETLPGQRLKVVLPDGSQITLNADSKLTYEVPFKNAREVKLLGEAFFDVVRDENNPFKVFSKGVNTTVLGTSFNVRAYPEDEESSVSVISGKVKVADYFGNQALLNPDMKGVFDIKKRQLTIEPFDEEQMVGWKDGILVFENAPIDQVFKKMERVYGVQFIIKDKQFIQGKYTGKFTNSSLERILDDIKYSMNFNYKINGKEIWITTE